MTHHPLVALRLIGADAPTTLAAMRQLQRALGAAVILDQLNHGRRGDWLAYGTLYVALPHPERQPDTADHDLRHLADAARRLVAAIPHLPAGALFTSTVWQDFVAAVPQRPEEV
jgi:hypothetical protein